MNYKPPHDAPVSTDQSDLPKVSQPMPLNGAAEPRPKMLTLTSTEFAELRNLKSRERGPFTTMAEFWHRVISRRAA